MYSISFRLCSKSSVSLITYNKSIHNGDDYCILYGIISVIFDKIHHYNCSVTSCSSYSAVFLQLATLGWNGVLQTVMDDAMGKLFPNQFPQNR